MVQIQRHKAKNIPQINTDDEDNADNTVGANPVFARQRNSPLNKGSEKTGEHAVGVIVVGVIYE